MTDMNADYASTQFPVNAETSEGLVRALTEAGSMDGVAALGKMMGTLIHSVMRLEIEIMKLKGDETAGTLWRTLEDPTPRPMQKPPGY
jgi:hypothetical protein